MNNENNNNLNGTVLGGVETNQSSVNNQTVNNQVETLGNTLDNNSVITPNQSGINESGTPEVLNSEVLGASSINQSAAGNLEANNLGTPNNNSYVASPNNTFNSGITPGVPNNTELSQPNPTGGMPKPMPGFENTTIGTTPPISFEPEQEPKKKKSNHLFFIIIVVLVLAGVGFGTYYVLKYTDIFSTSAQVSIKPKDISINIGDKLSTNPGDYADISGTDVKNCSVNGLEVDTNKAGSYEYTITCGETKQKGKIVVIDNRELEVETKTVYKTKGGSVTPEEFIKNSDSKATYEFSDKASVDAIINGEAGTYPVKIKVTNNNKNTEVEANLVITEYQIKGYLTCTSKEQNVNGLSAAMTVGERFAIQDDGNNGYAHFGFEIHTFKFSDETEYKDLKNKYEKDQKITVNDITGTPEFNDSEKEITFTNDLSENEANTRYGSENLDKYGSISSYFKNTLGYSCVYEKVQ